MTTTKNLSLGAVLLTSAGMVLPVAAIGTGCATTRMVGEQTDDARITGRVARSLSVDPDVRRFQIDVDTLDRVVTLRGTVSDEEAKDAAEQIARHTDGVSDVRNELRVTPSSSNDENMEERRVVGMEDEYDDDAEHDDDHEGSDGGSDEDSSDVVIRTKVGARLTTDPQVRRFNIDVDVQDGVVALSGIVHDELAKQEAEKIARNVEGVRGVDNELKVNPDDQDDP